MMYMCLMLILSFGVCDMYAAAVLRRERRLLLLFVLAYFIAVLAVRPEFSRYAVRDAVDAVSSATRALRWQMAAGNLLAVMTFYVPVGLLGLRLSRVANLPGIRRSQTPWIESLVKPLIFGAAWAAIMVLVSLAAQLGDPVGRMPPRPLPALMFASLAASIGQEIIFRLLFLSLCSVTIRWLVRKTGESAADTRQYGWLANGLATMAFVASQVGAATLAAGALSPLQLPLTAIAQVIGLHVGLGLLAGWMFSRCGLLAASGVHFAAHLMWSLVWGLV